MPESKPGETRRVLLTGARGFVGRPCLEALLERGFEVHAVTSGEVPAESSGALWRSADLLDAAQVRRLIQTVRPSHLLHLAWHSGSDVYRTRENYRWVSASLELLREFADVGGRRAVFAGSCAEYDWSHGLCSEATTPLEPSSTYGLCKRALFELFEGFMSGHDLVLTGAWARLFFLYGPHESPRRLIASVIRSALRGEPARCSHGRQLRDYLFTLDAAAALAAVLDSEVEGAINVASGEPTRLGELIRRAAGRLGAEDLVELGAIEVPAGDPPLVLADVGRLRKELGWRPAWDVDAALDHTIDWWRRHSA